MLYDRSLTARRSSARKVQLVAHIARAVVVYGQRARHVYAVGMNPHEI